VGTFSTINWELSDLVERTVAAGYLQDPSPAYSAARKAAEFGIGSLTLGEMAIYEFEVIRAIATVLDKAETQ
jgi:hypothetical protein